MMAIFQRLQTHNFTLSSFKIKDNTQEWTYTKQQKCAIWSSSSAFQTLEEIHVCNSHVLCSPEDFFQVRPMRNPGIQNQRMMHFARLKSVHIVMDAMFWEKQMSVICFSVVGAEHLRTNQRPLRRVSLIDNAPNLKNLSIEYNFNRFRYLRALNFELNLIIVYLGNLS